MVSTLQRRASYIKGARLSRLLSRSKLRTYIHTMGFTALSVIFDLYVQQRWALIGDSGKTHVTFRKADLAFKVNTCAIDMETQRGETWTRLFKTNDVVSKRDIIPMFISQICQYCLLKIVRSVCSTKASLIFSTKDISAFAYKVVKRLTR